MNRRGFLQTLVGVGATALAGELILPKRTFFLPPRGGWGAYPRASASEFMWMPRAALEDRPSRDLFVLLEQVERDMVLVTGMPAHLLGNGPLLNSVSHPWR